MTKEQASVAYWKAVSLLQEVINSEHRGSKEDVLGELEEDDLLG